MDLPFLCSGRERSLHPHAAFGDPPPPPRCRALLGERQPTSQGSTILLHVFIHLTETFTYQISLKCDLQNLEAN